jgi:hypothetical protein
MQDQQAPTPITTASAQPAGDRSTTFQASQGGTETRSGTLLMVEAYAVLWLLLLGWLVWLWRRQGALHARIDGLEKAMDRAVEKQAAAARAKKEPERAAKVDATAKEASEKA